MDFSGMTVNERLFEAGLLDEFDAAIKDKDRAKLEKILKKVALTTKQIEDVLEKYL